MYRYMYWPRCFVVQGRPSEERAEAEGAGKAAKAAAEAERERAL